LLRTDTEDAIYDFPWGQVHSWAHGPERFSFRFFEERLKHIQRYSFQLKDVDGLMSSIQLVIDNILNERKSKAISEEDFEHLKALVCSSEARGRLECILSSATMNFFTSVQANVLVAACDGAFDKVEAAAALHPRLVDQNHFSKVLEALECPEDKDNVWHRLSAMKKMNTVALRNRSI